MGPAETEFRQELGELIATGEGIVDDWRKRQPPVSLSLDLLPTLPVLVNAESFHGWRTRSLIALMRGLGPTSSYTAEFERATSGPIDVRVVQAGIGILKAISTSIKRDQIRLPSVDARLPIEGSAIPTIERICSRLHRIAKRLKNRHNSRPTLEISDEYDLQDLVHALLELEFEDVRAEEVTPSYAGNSSRMDFLLKRLRIVLELKLARVGLGNKELANQLAVDIQRYRSHPDCGVLVCFIYDPLGIIQNPEGLEHDLSSDDGQMPVRVFVRPR